MGPHSQEPISFDRRIPALDGIRGLAIALVLFFHYGFAGWPAEPGTLSAYLMVPFRLTWSGVDCFFVLSGFLIGGILLDARGSSAYFRTFSARRCCRILPLYAVMVALFEIAIRMEVLSGSVLTNDPCPLPAYLTFTQNFWMVYTDHISVNGLSPSWSLAIEEQFYLALPVLVWLLSQRVLIIVTMCLVALAPIFRVLTAPHVPLDATYYLSFCRMDDLCLGVLGAALVRNEQMWSRLRERPRVLYAALGLTSLAMALVTYGKPKYLFHNNYTLIATFYLCLLLTAVALPSGPVAQLARRRSLRHLGVLCYGLYLFHMPMLELCHFVIGRGTSFPRMMDLPSALATGCALIFTFALAELSWKYFERPFVRLGHRIGYSGLLSEAEDPAQSPYVEHTCVPTRIIKYQEAQPERHA